MRLLTALALLALAQDGPGPLREELVLPHGLTGQPDPLERAEVVNVRIDGAVAARGDLLVPALDPSAPAPSLEPFAAWLAARPAPTADGPGERLLVLRAEQNTPFERCRELVERAPGWTVLFAFGDARAARIDPDVGLLPSAEPLGVLPLGLEPDPGPGAGPDATPPAPAERSVLSLRVRVLAPGARLERTRAAEVPWKGEGRYRWNLKTRRVAYELDGRELESFSELVVHLQTIPKELAGRRIRIETASGVTTAEVLGAADALRGLGAVPFLARS